MTINEYIKNYGVTISNTRIPGRADASASEWDASARHWIVELTRVGKVFRTYYSQGSAHKKAPTAADVLESLILDASYGGRDFESFCRDSGYDVDSRAAERLFHACQDTARRLTVWAGTSARELLAVHE